jgi:hypothetical protein
MSISQELLEAYSQATIETSHPAADFKERMDLVRQVMLESPKGPGDGAYLVVRTPDCQKLFPLKQDICIGSDPGSDLVLACGFISRNHCRLHLDQSDWVVEDLNSTNGVRLNGSPLRRAILKDGDILQLGTVMLVFLDDSERVCG